MILNQPDKICAKNWKHYEKFYLTSSRITSTGDLLAVWNHNPGAAKRNPLTAAVSADEGETWTHFRNLETAPDDAWAYPAVTWVGEQALLTYFNYRGGLSLKLRILPAAWFYASP